MHPKFVKRLSFLGMESILESAVAKKRSKTEAVEKNLTEKDRTYTAVELVTKACKVCGIVENTEKHSSTFTTADWS